MIVDIEQPCILKGEGGDLIPAISGGQKVISLGFPCARCDGLVGCRVSTVEFTSKKTTHAGRVGGQQEGCSKVITGFSHFSSCRRKSVTGR